MTTSEMWQTICERERFESRLKEREGGGGVSTIPEKKEEKSNK